VNYENSNNDEDEDLGLEFDADETNPKMAKVQGELNK
jgi:hypothetical protein